MSAEFCKAGVSRKTYTKIPFYSKMENAGHFSQVHKKLTICLLPLEMQGLMSDSCLTKGRVGLTRPGRYLGMICPFLPNQSKVCEFQQPFKHFQFPKEFYQRVVCPQKKEMEYIFKYQSRQGIESMQMKDWHGLH